MFFVTLAKMRGKTTPAFMRALESPLPGLKIHNIFWTLGQYDFVIIYEAPNEKRAMRMAIRLGEFCETQTMVAVASEEARDLIKARAEQARRLPTARPIKRLRPAGVRRTPDRSERF